MIFTEGNIKCVIVNNIILKKKNKRIRKHLRSSLKSSKVKRMSYVLSFNQSVKYSIFTLFLCIFKEINKFC